MPWKNPKCPKCRGKSKKVGEAVVKWIYKCNYCGYLFQDWGRIPKRNNL